jgi:hypothetical protein
MAKYHATKDYERYVGEAPAIVNVWNQVVINVT